MKKAKEVNYKRLGLKCGLEIHQQLDTEHKLFCNCSTTMQEKEPLRVVRRKQHPVASELGEVDVAAQYEYLRDRTFHYQVFPNETCLVELDEEPIHPLNQEPLNIALQIALLLKCEIPNEIHIMRKTLIDGSAISGFQRTMVVGLNGYLRYKGKKIEIKHVSLEEDAAAIVSEQAGAVTYRLSRLGVPLVEIATGLLKGYNPKQVQDIAYLIGIICKSTGKTKRGIGSIRQDLNVSIRRGARVEIKGIQELGMLAKVIEKEVERQLLLPKVKEETRAVNPDGTTRFTRPLPGAARIYPETDHPPVAISRQTTREIKRQLPEPWTKKLGRFKRKLKLSDELAKQMLRSDHLELFERIVERKAVRKKVEPSVVANTFVALLKDLRKREKVKVDNLTDRHFVELFDMLARKRIVKEAIPEILKHLAKNPKKRVSEAIKKLGLKMIRKTELRRIIKQAVKENPNLKRDKIFGIVMSRVRGKADPQVVMKVVRKVKRR